MGTGETGLDYATFRYYGASLGRFLSPDLLRGSLTAPQSLNHYSYTSNDPINFIDPLGLCQGVIGRDDDGNPIVGEKPCTNKDGSGGDDGVDSGGGGGGGDGGEDSPGDPCGGGPCGQGGDRGGGGGTGTKPTLNLRALFDCIMSMFGINGLSFEESVKGQNGNPGQNGIFRGEGAQDNSHYVDGTFGIVNSVEKNKGTLTFMAIAAGHDVSVVDGYTSAANPYTNYTASNAAAGDFVNLQVWELGNSLALISGTVSILYSWAPKLFPELEPGNVLTECVKNGGPPGQQY